MFTWPFMWQEKKCLIEVKKIENMLKEKLAMQPALYMLE